MKKLMISVVLFTSIFGFFGCKSSNDPSSWDSKKIDDWFQKGEYLNGWAVTPDVSINKKEFAVSYFKNKERWDKAFAFLKNNDLNALEPKRHDIDGNNLYAIKSEYLTKNAEDTRFEAHKNYIDIQYVISGSEQISAAPVSMLDSVLVAYDTAKDCELMTVKKCDNLIATPDKFFVYFPSDLHRPGVKIDENAPVKKIVVKVKID
jgi:biofilm protein TabA